MISSVCVLFVALAAASALELPNYIKPCSLSDSNFKKCLTDSITSALPNVVEGDKTYKVVGLNPVTLPLVEISLGDDVKMVFTEASFIAFENAKVKDVSYDAAKQHILVHFLNPVVKADTHYNMNMKLFGLSIKGEGPANLTFNDVDITLGAQLKTIQKNGVDYFAVESASATFVPNSVSLYFANLFNGDPTLGPVTNQLLNDNWKEFIGLLDPTIKQIFSGLMKNTLGAYLALVPKDKVFLP